MVALVQAASAPTPPAAPGNWRDLLHGTYADGDIEALGATEAFVRDAAGDATLPDGAPLAARGVEIAAILAPLKLDAATLHAALVLPLVQARRVDAATIAARLSGDVAALVGGVVRMEDIRAMPAQGTGAERETQAENLRKMLLAMVEDIRVVLIKLAERTAALRHAMGGDAAARKRAAQDVVDLFAPLANRLGVWQLKWELEDLALRALEPDAYRRIAALLDERRVDRERYIEGVVATLKRELAASGIRADVSGRPKHIHSIWRKMRRKQAGIDALYDIRALRVLVDEVRDCYAALGVVHHLWAPLPDEFDDYIAKPKANQYRSLHTAVIGPDGRALEVQIRTREMHQHSEYGIAAHWRYKEGVAPRSRDAGFDEKIAWLRQILDWRDTVAAGSDLVSAFKSSLFTESIYVLTPQGKVIDLPRGATPVDFAYAVHTDLGHRCRGARVDGQLVPLDTPLANGQQVAIVAAKEGGPSRDWLNPELGYVTSHRARAKVRQWFKAQQLEATIAQGRALVERELARLGQSLLKLDAVAAKAGFAKADEFFAAFARDEINSRQVQTAILALAQPQAAPAAAPPDAVETKRSRAGGSGGGILVVGVDRLMTGLARCCKPAPPDPIVGFITRGKGVTIHRDTCANVARIREREPERLIDADWGAARDEVFPVDVVVEAMDRQGLLRDISEVFSREKINVTAARTLTRNMQSRMAFTVEVASVESLKRALALVRDVAGVLSASRR
jgi:GTP pyrophosphokinase